MKTLILLLTITLQACAGTAVLYDKDPDAVRECADLASAVAEEAYKSCVAKKLVE